MKLSDSEQVRKEKPAFPWLVTPNFFFCFLLVFCLFVPGFQGCNGTTVYIGTGLQSPFVGFTNLSQLLAVVVLVTTYLWCVAPTKEQKTTGSKFAWRSFCVLAVANFLLTSGFFWYVLIFDEGQSSDSSWEASAFFIAIVVYITSPAVASLITFKSGQSQFSKASIMQLVLSLAGIASALYFLPTFMLAGKSYIGGKLNVVGVFGLLFMSVVQLIDGERSLNRKGGDPIVRLTLKQSFLLMTIACVLCSLATGLFVIEPPPSKSNPQVQSAEVSSN